MKHTSTTILFFYKQHIFIINNLLSLQIIILILNLISNIHKSFFLTKKKKCRIPAAHKLNFKSLLSRIGSLVLRKKRGILKHLDDDERDNDGSSDDLDTF